MRSGASVLLLAGIVSSAVTLSACGGGRHPSPEPSQSQIRSDSDRFFDRMKQEERERGA